jgi:dTDP-4-dehydrorhamnose 3,5-epimerase-like enzyme
MHHINSDRGGHAHTDTDQVVIAISGSFTIKLFDGIDSVIFKMNDPIQGLYIPRMIFIELSDFSSDAVCLVLASTHYDIKKSIRNIDDYNSAISQKNDRS